MQKEFDTNSEKGDDLFDSSPKIHHVQHVDNPYEDEDIDIKVVNELATVQDDTSLPCYTVRVFVTGIVSIN